jgi:hypothetical protein
MNAKLKKEIARASGMAGALQRQADKLMVSARLPYQAIKNQGTCSVCNQRLAAGSPYSVIPHTPKTCPGAAMRTSMGG